MSIKFISFGRMDPHVCISYFVCQRLIGVHVKKVMPGIYNREKAAA